VVICLEQGADLHIAQLLSLPLTISCFSKIQIGFTFLVPANPGSPGKKAVKRVCVFFFLILVYYYRSCSIVCVCVCVTQMVTLVKVDGSLGMSIVGGINKVCHPFGATEHGIFISKVICTVFNCIGLDICYCTAFQSDCYKHCIRIMAVPVPNIPLYRN